MRDIRRGYDAQEGVDLLRKVDPVFRDVELQELVLNGSAPLKRNGKLTLIAALKSLEKETFAAVYTAGTYSFMIGEIITLILKCASQIVVPP